MRLQRGCIRGMNYNHCRQQTSVPSGAAARCLLISLGSLKPRDANIWEDSVPIGDLPSHTPHGAPQTPCTCLAAGGTGRWVQHTPVLGLSKVRVEGKGGRKRLDWNCPARPSLRRLQRSPTGKDRSATVRSARSDPSAVCKRTMPTDTVLTEVRVLFAGSSKADKTDLKRERAEELVARDGRGTVNLPGEKMFYFLVWVGVSQGTDM